MSGYGRTVGNPFIKYAYPCDLTWIVAPIVDIQQNHVEITEPRCVLTGYIDSIPSCYQMFRQAYQNLRTIRVPVILVPRSELWR